MILFGVTTPNQFQRILGSNDMREWSYLVNSKDSEGYGQANIKALAWKDSGKLR
jgi:hypothetical protein